jgi:hypothetical protein
MRTQHEVLSCRNEQLLPGFDLVRILQIVCLGDLDVFVGVAVEVPANLRQGITGTNCVGLWPLPNLDTSTGWYFFFSWSNRSAMLFAPYRHASGLMWKPLVIAQWRKTKTKSTRMRTLGDKTSPVQTPFTCTRTASWFADPLCMRLRDAASGDVCLPVPQHSINTWGSMADVSLATSRPKRC